MIPAVLLMLLPVSSCSNDIERGTIQDVLAALPGDAKVVATVSMADLRPCYGADNAAIELFSQASSAGDTGLVALVQQGHATMAVAPVGDPEKAEQVSAGWERVNIGDEDAVSGRVHAAHGGTVVLAGNTVWLLGGSYSVGDADRIVSAAYKKGSLGKDVRGYLEKAGTSKPRAFVRVGGETCALLAVTADKDGLVIDGEVCDTLGNPSGVEKRLEPINALPDTTAQAAVVVGLPGQTLAKLIDAVGAGRDVQVRMALGVVRGMFSDAGGTTMLTAKMVGDKVEVRFAIPFKNGSAEKAARMIRGFAHDVDALGKFIARHAADGSLEVKMLLPSKGLRFDGEAVKPDLKDFAARGICAAAWLAPMSEDGAAPVSLSAVAYERTFSVRLGGIGLADVLCKALGLDDGKDKHLQGGQSNDEGGAYEYDTYEDGTYEYSADDTYEE